MRISELRPGMRRVDVKGQIIDLQSPREVSTKFGPGEVSNAVLRDESGQVIISLWNDQINKVAVGRTVAVENGYVTSFRGDLQLNVGRYGKMEVSN